MQAVLMLPKNNEDAQKFCTMIAVKNTHSTLILFSVFLLHFYTSTLGQVHNSPLPVMAELPTDTNAIVAITYPELTKREGKTLQLPVPPAAHPRLYLMPKDIAELQQKMGSPQMQKCKVRLLSAAAFSTDGLLQLTGAKHNNNIEVRNAIEAKALLYVLNQNKASGDEALSAVLNYFATLKIDPALPDVSREIGRAIVTGSIVYDWCYPLLSAAQKSILIGRMETLAIQMEIAWPQIKSGSITSHTVEAQMARDMLSLSIATYNENPIIYKRVAGRIFSEFLPARQFFYPAGYHHQGTAYGAYRFYWDVWTTLIFDRMGYPNIYGKDQQKVPGYFMYNRRPDGQMMRDGDDYNEQFTPFGKWWELGKGALLYAGSYFKNPIVISEGLKERAWGDASDYLFDFLFADVGGYNAAATKSTLPLSQYFPKPLGAMVARTGWEHGIASNDVIATMKIQAYNFSNHQHLDAGSFQLYYKGPLAVQSGIYQGTNGGYGSEHFKNYSQRSIAHNTMLVHDPKEKFIWHNQPIINDGGQPYPNDAHEPVNMNELLTQGYETGEVLAHSFGPDTLKPEYTYLKGELAKAYGKKVNSFQRSFVFLNLGKASVPAVLIVNDRVVAADKNFKKTWLLHCVEEPHINGGTTTVSRTEKGYSGRLLNTTLLPQLGNVYIKKTGGAGKEFFIADRNFPQSIVAPANAGDSAVWRIEVSPKIPNQTDHFLNVMQVMDYNDSLQNLPIEKLETDLFTGVIIGDRVVLFSKTGKRIAKPFKIKITKKKAFKVLIADVQNGQWQLVSVHQKKPATRQVKSDGHSLYFNAGQGSYLLKPL